ncbi:hypothetical protein ACN27F_15975 [Solwaraspora sp. WMMB335]|uniref:hypothetical protein n=1 Tax=Solwaraspora sp. WMMB335 TaxID=3404118 RepID=UPI003B94A2E2
MSTGSRTEPIDVAALGAIGTRLGSGGQAVVYELPGFSLPGTPDRLVYKQYRPGAAPRRQAVDELVDRRAQLGESDRRRLDSIAAWPLRLVTDASEVRGVVLPRIPETFFQTIVLPSKRTKEIPREVQHLFVDPERCRRIGVTVPSPEQRLEICRDFAAALSFLHGPSVGVVFGDINAKNELFRLGAAPTVMFVDCDAARMHGSVANPLQLNAPDWTPPDRSPALSRHTDLYKLGLFVLRCLTFGEQASTRTDPLAAADVLDDHGIDLLRAAVTGPAAGRPSAPDWHHYLSWVLGQPLGPPTLTGVEVDRTLVAAGEPVTVRWLAQQADAVEIAVPGGAARVAGNRTAAGSIEAYPVRSGRIAVTARNKAGSARSETVPVAVLDATGWSDLPVAVPRLPLPSGGQPRLPDLSTVLPPMVAVDPVPSAPLPLLPSTTDRVAWAAPALPRRDTPGTALPTGGAVAAPCPPDILAVTGLSLLDTDASGPIDVTSMVTSGPDIDLIPDTGSPFGGEDSR